MKSLMLLSALLLFTACSPAPCDCDPPVTPEPNAKADATPPVSHPLKGVIKELMPYRSSLLVKHEEIPGFMMAMTMVFKVDPSVLSRVKAGDTIQAQMSRRDNEWWLHEVETVKPAK